jgi:hypothetical protein
MQSCAAGNRENESLEQSSVWTARGGGARCAISWHGWGDCLRRAKVTRRPTHSARVAEGPAILPAGWRGGVESTALRGSGQRRSKRGRDERSAQRNALPPRTLPALGLWRRARPRKEAAHRPPCERTGREGARCNCPRGFARHPDCAALSCFAKSSSNAGTIISFRSISSTIDCG